MTEYRLQARSEGVRAAESAGVKIAYEESTSIPYRMESATPLPTIDSGLVQAKRSDFSHEPMKDLVPHSASAAPWAGRNGFSSGDDAVVTVKPVEITHSIWRRP